MSAAPAHIHMATKPIHTLEDLSGQKLWAPSAISSSVTKLFGAVPLFMPPQEVFTALERGMIDGYGQSFSATKTFKWMELLKHHTYVGLWASKPSVLMNLDVWNSLPPDIQKIIDDTTGFEASRAAGVLYDAKEKADKELVEAYDKEHGNPEVYYLPEDEKARWLEAISPFFDTWVEEKEAEGLPGRAFFNDLVTIAKKYNK